MCVFVVEEERKVCFRVSGKRGLQEVSLCPLVTLELVTPYFLLFIYACTPTHPTHTMSNTSFPSLDPPFTLKSVQDPRLCYADIWYA